MILGKNNQPTTSTMIVRAISSAVSIPLGFLPPAVAKKGWPPPPPWISPEISHIMFVVLLLTSLKVKKKESGKAKG